MSLMNILAELDQLNLELSARTQVAQLIQSLMEQQAQDVKLIQAKDVKIAAHRTPSRTGILHLRSMRSGIGQDRRRCYRTTGCRAGQVFRASAHSSTIHLRSSGD